MKKIFLVGVWYFFEYHSNVLQAMGLTWDGFLTQFLPGEFAETIRFVVLVCFYKFYQLFKGTITHP